MKKTLLVITLAFLAFAAESQDITTMDKFVGTWRWVSGTDTVLIVLQRQNTFIKPGINLQALVGWHKYVQNGQTVQSSLQYVGRDESVEHTDITTDLKTTMVGNAKNTTTIWFTTFWDLTLHSSCFLTLSLLPGSTTQASWKLSSSGVKITNSGGYTVKPVSILPKRLTLTKI